LIGRAFATKAPPVNWLNQKKTKHLFYVLPLLPNSKGRLARLNTPPVRARPVYFPSVLRCWPYRRKIRPYRSHSCYGCVFNTSHTVAK
jgi:hypothetical protein